MERARTALGEYSETARSTLILSGLIVEQWPLACRSDIPAPPSQKAAATHPAEARRKTHQRASLAAVRTSYVEN
jgi:hypothetical protein